MTEKAMVEHRLTLVDFTGVRIRRHDFPVVDSTLDRAKECIDRGNGDWTLVTADSQLRGRGTRGRSWVSHPGAGLWISLALPPAKKTDFLDGLTLRTAEVLVDALSTVCNPPFTIKPPNDILIRGRKCAGILYESATADGSVQALILGLGLNVSQTETDFARAGLPDATSLFIETGERYDREDILNAFLERFVVVYPAEFYRDGTSCPASRQRGAVIL